MFYPEKMSKITIASSKSNMEKITNSLYKLGVLHIKEYVPKDGELEIGSPLSEANLMSEVLLDIQSIKSQVDMKNVKKKESNLSIQEARDKIKTIREAVSKGTERIKEIDERMEKIKTKENEFDFLTKAGIKNLDSIAEYDNFEMKFGYIKNPKKANEKLKDFAVFSGEKQNSPIIVFYPKNKEKEVKKALEKDFSEEKINILEKGSITDNNEKLKKEKLKLKEEKKEIKKNLDLAATVKGPELLFLEQQFSKKLEKAQAPLKFASSSNAFVVQGWVPRKNKEKVVQEIQNISKDAFVKVDDVNLKDAPTKVNNPGPVKPFEFFLNMYSLPKYNEIDPSFLVFLTFPLFYGIILGDIGYGLVIIALALLLRPKFKNIRALLDITIMSGISSIIFGIVFGEFFGSEYILDYHLPHLIHRVHEVNGMLLISAMLGFLHVNAGFILGFINEKKKHGIKVAIYEKISWIGLQLAGILLLLNVTGVFPGDVYLYSAIGLFLISLAAVIKGHGGIGIIEIPSLAGNVLSYLRLTAVGLASASLALVVNQMTGPMFQAGGLNIVLGAFVLILGHSVNIALGILGGFLHSLRLHYVEMFSKFYTGSGKAYKPFGDTIKEVK